jgi:hypothetical protein
MIVNKHAIPNRTPKFLPLRRNYEKPKFFWCPPPMHVARRVRERRSHLEGEPLALTALLAPSHSTVETVQRSEG